MKINAIRIVIHGCSQISFYWGLLISVWYWYHSCRACIDYQSKTQPHWDYTAPLSVECTWNSLFVLYNTNTHTHTHTHTHTPWGRLEWSAQADWHCEDKHPIRHSDYEPAHPQTHAKNAHVIMLTELCWLFVLFGDTCKLLSNHGYELFIVFMSIGWNSLFCKAPHKSYLHVGASVSQLFSEGAWLLCFFHSAEVTAWWK